ncbi:ferredoxin [Rubrivivax gelatinosus]|uniref:electron transport complex subunit RsxB n=1 Tax=Rubrivivax gelatinosus TaxID=28068 RepID=UPI0019034E76|nr:ferredoxin [Rubrivivax gelatinosus]
MTAARPDTLAARIDAALPQTQCRRCGYPDCQAYADAIAGGAADIDRCPPGGAEGVARLAALLGVASRPLDTSCGAEGPRRLALIDEAWCIGCTLCIEACPVDCIVGAPKHMHTVVDALCTGCELCIPACPVDCIVLEDATPGASGWAAWSPALADEARTRYARHRLRLERERRERDDRLAARAAAPQPALPAATAADERKRAVIDAALARARARRQAA